MDTPQRHAITLRPAGLRRLKQGHPWIYDGSIASVKGDPALGSIGVVFDSRDRFAGFGLLDPTSPIFLRLLSTERAEFNADWLGARVAESIARRQPLEAANTGMRLVNGEGDGLPGLIVDRYGEIVVLKVYTAAWLPYLDWLTDTLSGSFSAGALRLAGKVSKAGFDERTLWGDLGDGVVTFAENTLAFEANVLTGHKTGHFFDQRANRARFGQMAAGAHVLDAFSCTGGFAVHAAAGGALTLTLTDLSQPALDGARRNLELNGFSPTSTLQGDAFEVLAAQPPRRYDLAVVDPPAFASRSAHRDRCLDAYRTLARLTWPTLRPGGALIQASCSAYVDASELRQAVLDGISQAQDSLGVHRVEWESGHDLDHPIRHAEGSYLKALAVRKQVG